MEAKPAQNMYSDSIQQWPVLQGCGKRDANGILRGHNCKYCGKSFRLQAKRQKPHYDERGNRTRGCPQCYAFETHFHPERLNASLRATSGDQFIWIGASSDPAFANPEDILKIFARVRKFPKKQFFMQTKDPSTYWQYDQQFPPNLWLGTTLETNRDAGYFSISDAPCPTVRYQNLRALHHDLGIRFIITIEPVLNFDLEVFRAWLLILNPLRIYVGYDTKKCQLPEPPLQKTRELMASLQLFTVVKPKLLREAWDRE